MGVHRIQQVERPSAGAADKMLAADLCSHVKLSATRRSDAGIGFRGAGGECKHGQRKCKVRMTDGHVAGSTWQVADVKRPFMSVAKKVAAGNRVHLASNDPRIVRLNGDVILERKLETCSSSICDQQETESRSLRDR